MRKLVWFAAGMAVSYFFKEQIGEAAKKVTDQLNKEGG